MNDLENRFVAKWRWEACQWGMKFRCWDTNDVEIQLMLGHNWCWDTNVTSRTYIFWIGLRISESLNITVKWNADADVYRQNLRGRNPRYSRWINYLIPCRLGVDWAIAPWTLTVTFRTLLKTSLKMMVRKNASIDYLGDACKDVVAWKVTETCRGVWQLKRQGRPLQFLVRQKTESDKSLGHNLAWYITISAYLQ